MSVPLPAEVLSGPYCYCVFCVCMGMVHVWHVWRSEDNLWSCFSLSMSSGHPVQNLRPICSKHFYPQNHLIGSKASNVLCLFSLEFWRPVLVIVCANLDLTVQLKMADLEFKILSSPVMTTNSSVLFPLFLVHCQSKFRWPKPPILYFFSFIIGAWIQSFVHVRQVLYHWATFPVLSFPFLLRACVISAPDFLRSFVYGVRKGSSFFLLPVDVQ